MKAVIMAGGGGTRLWPASRANKPKQSQTILGKETLLEKTYSRVRKSFSLKDIYVTLGAQHYKQIKKELKSLPANHFSVEPSLQDTAPAIGLIALILNTQDPDSAMITLSSDHYIKNEKAFDRTMKAAEAAIKKYPDYTGVLGVNPTYPETGYGYIKIGRQMDQINKIPVFAVKQFVEKPNLKIAQGYLKKNDYLWNSGNFIWKTAHLLDLFKEHQPIIYKKFKQLQLHVGKPSWTAQLKKVYPSLKKISIDFAILEKTKKIFCLPAQFDWADVGHWRSVKEILSETADQNVVLGKHLGIDTKGSLIYNLSDKLVATSSVEDMIIINTKDAILICPKDKAQDVKKIVEAIKKKGYQKYL